MRNIFWSLKHRHFRVLWGASVIAGISMWAMTIARAWLVFDLSGSALAVGFITFSAFFGTFVMVPLGGVLADRGDRRALLILSMALPMLLALVLAALTVTDAVGVWQVIVLSFLASFVRSMGMPADRALTPSYVPTEDLLNAISLRNAGMRGPRLLGPLLATPLLATLGPEGVFLAATGLYGVATLNLLRLPKPQPVEARSANVSLAGDFAEGIRYVTRVSPVNVMVGVVAAHCALTMSFDSLLPSLAREELDGGASLFSYFSMAIGAGGLVATLSIAPMRSASSRGLALLITGLASGVSLIMVAGSDGVLLALIALGLAGGSQAAFMSLTEVLLIEVVPDRLRGRAMGVYTMINVGLMALFSLVNGWIADVWSVSELFLVLGAVFLAFTFITYLGSRRIRLIYSNGVLQMPQAAPA